MLIYFIDVLKHDIGGTAVNINSLESKISSIKDNQNMTDYKQQMIKNTQDKLNEIVTILVKINAISADKIGRFGPLPNHDDKIKEYKKELQKYLESDFDEKMKTEIDSLNNSYK